MVNQARKPGGVVWFTGLSGSGKSTLARSLHAALSSCETQSVVLDGDEIRRGLSADLGLDSVSRIENIRRVSHIAALLAESGLISICALISPFAEGRRKARKAARHSRFVEIYLDVDLAVCERRDPKGLYARARRGEIAQFTGIDSPYEVPCEPDLAIDTDELSPAAATGTIIETLSAHRILEISR